LHARSFISGKNVAVVGAGARGDFRQQTHRLASLAQFHPQPAFTHPAITLIKN